MNNRRSLKENLTISNKQRFSIRKFSIGVASVMLGTTLYFMGGVGPSIVHADSVDQPVQTQTSKDINSAQASSDATLAQQNSDQNQSQVSSVQNDEKTTNDQTAVKLSQQATNASAAKSNTQDSKKAVSDTNETKSVANKAQTSDQLATATSDKSSQQVAKTDTKNSNTLDIKQNKQRLAGNVKLNALTDNKAQTDTQTNSKYSVTDNYPADLTNYLPSTFNNKQEYAFEWLQTQTGNNIILTTNRTGDGVVYVYQDRKKVGKLAQNKSLDLDFGADSYHDEYTGADFYYGEYTGTVYNDNKSGLVQSNPVKVDKLHSDYNKLTVIYSSHAKDVEKGSFYTGISFFVPHKITQTVTYKDSTGAVIPKLTHTQDGLTGQSYTTGLPSGSDYVRSGEYLDNITNNGSGLISEFGDGYSCTKDYHDGVSVTFTENDSNGIGTMDYVVKDHGIEVKSGTLTYGNSAEYDKYAWNGLYWYKSHSYTIVNPYVPQTTNIIYQYKELGRVITTDPSGNTTKPHYTNDQHDPTKIEPVNAKPITGYSAIVKYENKIVSDKNFMPTNLGENTYITYTANDQTATITYIDDTTGKTLHTDTADGKFGDVISFTNKPSTQIKTYEGQGYNLVSNSLKDTDTYNADNTKNSFTVHLKHGTHDVTRYDTVTRTIHYVYANSKQAKPDSVQTVKFTENGVHDDVTNTDTWTPAESQSFKDVATPSITGYTPDKTNVKGIAVNFGDSDGNETVTYTANDQTATITYIDDTTGKTLHTDTADGKFGDVISFTNKPSTQIKTYEGQGYNLVSNSLKDTDTYNADNTKNSFTVHLVHGQKANVRNSKEDKAVTRTIKYHFAGTLKDAAPTKVQTIKFEAYDTIDQVTGKIINTAYTPATSQTFGAVTSPVVKGYTPDRQPVTEQKGITPQSSNILVIVHYSADAQKATINYIDDTTRQTIKSDTINGNTGDTIADPTAQISNYKNQGYKLVSDDLANGASFDNDDTTDQAFYIHLNHDTETITPDHPKVPGTPINPSGDAKYPGGVDKESLTKTITRTINYVDNKGNKVNGSPDGKSTYVQTVTFTRTVTIDKVTGDIKSSTPWVPANGTWSQVNSRDPHELGYDSVDISAVGSKIVTSNSKDETITVTYSKDGDTPTPTPEPNPDPNPQPSDPRNVPAPSTPTSHPTQPTNNKKDDENKDNNSNPKKRHNPNKPTVKTGSTRNNNPKINNNTSAKVANGKTSKAAKTLPQTGENNKFGLIGLLFAAFGVVFGLAGDRKRKN